MDNITYLEDIVSELSTEFDIPEKEMEEICALSIKYIQNLIKTPGIISINLPRLGVLHFNAKRAKYTYKVASKFRRYIYVVQSQLDLITKLKKTSKDLVHSRNSYYIIFKKFFYKDKLERRLARERDFLVKIETKQNNLK